eukprot:2007984-Pleurochrysis_carterae.AAC.3
MREGVACVAGVSHASLCASPAGRGRCAAARAPPPRACGYAPHAPSPHAAPTRGLRARQMTAQPRKRDEREAAVRVKLAH